MNFGIRRGLVSSESSVDTKGNCEVLSDMRNKQPPHDGLKSTEAEGASTQGWKEAPFPGMPPGHV